MYNETMPSKSKRKGNVYESELVEQLDKEGISAKRAWGSNGAALGEAETVDLVFLYKGLKWRVQAKRRAKIADYMKPPDGADIVMARGDRESTLVVMPFQKFIKLLKGYNE